MKRNKLLANVPPDKMFLVWHDNKILKNLPELVEALKSMTDETYGFHANSQRNDFANWIRDVVGARNLAGDLIKAKNRADAHKILKTYIDEAKIDYRKKKLKRKFQREKEKAEKDAEKAKKREEKRLGIVPSFKIKKSRKNKKTKNKSKSSKKKIKKSKKLSKAKKTLKKLGAKSKKSNSRIKKTKSVKKRASSKNKKGKSKNFLKRHKKKLKSSKKARH